MYKWIIFFIGMLVLLSPAWSMADEGKGTKGTVTELEEIVVTATRQEEQISSVPANVSVITQEEIENSPAQDVPNLLRSEMGVHVSDISGNQRSYVVDLRGFGETGALNTLVLVDGRRINQADLSGTDWTLVPLDRIERIEIIRGGRGSVLYGDNAAGGVINIITKKGREFKASAEAAGGSYATYKADARVSGTKKDLSYILSGSYLTSDGYRDNSDTLAKDIGMNLDYYVTQSVMISLSSGYHEDDTGLPGAIKESDFESSVSREDTLYPDDYTDKEDYYIQVGPEIHFMENSLFKLDMAYRNRESLFFSAFTGGTFEGDTEIETISASPQLILKEKIYGFDNSLTLGADFIEDEEEIVNSTSYMGATGSSKFRLEKENYGFYAHEELSILEKLIVSAGYRYEKAEYKFAPSTPDETEISEDLGTAGITYHFFGNSQAYFSYSRSTRYPVLDEFFNFQTNSINTELKPQTSDDYELGFRFSFSEKFDGKINLFRIDTDNEILFDPTKGFFGANTNLDAETRRDGVEIALTKDFEAFRLSGSYSYTDAEIRGGKFDGNDFPGVPEHQASVSTTFSPVTNLTVSLNGIYVGKRPFISDFENSFDDQDEYFLANTKLKYRWKEFTTYLQINNLFDQEYSEYGVASTEKSYYPSPKIHFLLGLSVEM